MEHQELQVTLVHRVLKDHKVHLDPQDLKDLRDL